MDNTSSNKDDKNRFSSFLDLFKKDISSSALHFILGAGFNNTVLPLAADLKNVIYGLNKIVNLKYPNENCKNIEEGINSLDLTEEQYDKVYNCFLQNIKIDLKTDYDHNSYNSIHNYLKNDPDNNDLEKKPNKIACLELINSLISYVKRLNKYKSFGIGNNPSFYKTYFWTLNYDNLLLKLLINNKLPFFLVEPAGFDYLILDTNLYLKSINSYESLYFIIKLHGNYEYPIIPSRKKYDEIFKEDRYFSTFIKFKEILCSNPYLNNLIIIIGYSGGDRHINEVINDAFNSGNKIIFLDYNTDSKVYDDSKLKVNFNDNLIEALCKIELNNLNSKNSNFNWNYKITSDKPLEVLKYIFLKICETYGYQQNMEGN